jgi:DNA-binding IclR family transcriptional regulator
LNVTSVDDTGTRSGATAQTLERGLRILGSLGESPEGLSIAQVAAKHDIHRSIAARLLATLAKHGFATRGADGRYRLGLTVFTLARSVSQNVMLTANPLMAEVAARLNATVVFNAADGAETVTMASIEPPTGSFRLGVRPGSRRPIEVGAQGIAILSGRPPLVGERKEVGEARERGYALSVGEFIPNFAGVCAPIMVGDECNASVGCVVPAERLNDLVPFGEEVIDLAHRISLLYG